MTHHSVMPCCKSESLFIVLHLGQIWETVPFALEASWKSTVIITLAPAVTLRCQLSAEIVVIPAASSSWYSLLATLSCPGLPSNNISRCFWNFCITVSRCYPLRYYCLLRLTSLERQNSRGSSIECPRASSKKTNWRLFILSSICGVSILRMDFAISNTAVIVTSVLHATSAVSAVRFSTRARNKLDRAV